MANKGQKLLMAAPTLVLAEAASAMAHGGGLGAIAAFGVAGLAYAYADEIKAAFQRGDDSPAGPGVRSESGSKLKKAGYRLLVGKSVRGEDQAGDDASWDDDEEIIPLAVGRQKDMFLFSHVLESGFVPTLSALYLGRDESGKPITVAARDLCHVALPGLTGGGKSSIMRLIMAQLCFLGVPTLLLNPHYMRFNSESDEDNTPFEAHLQRSPLDCAGFDAIKVLLQWMAETLLKKRIEQRANGGKPGKPYIIFIDEWPSIVGDLGKDASKYLGKILREGRKYGIFVVLASTDFQVKTLGLEGDGSLRKCFLTTFYVGGDPVGAKELLNLAANELPENQLGRGTVMLRYRADMEIRTVIARVPFTDNEALYRLLGPSTFTSSQDDDPLADNNDDPADDDVETSDPQMEGLVEDPVLVRARLAYENGATSVIKLAAALDISEWDARKIMAKIRVEKHA